MRAIKTDKKAAKPIRPGHLPALDNGDHERLAECLTYISNNLAVMRQILGEHKVNRKVKGAVGTAQSAVNRLNERLQAEYQAINRPRGPYPAKD
jgi:hypothetical protein